MKKIRRFFTRQRVWGFKGDLSVCLQARCSGRAIDAMKMFQELAVKKKRRSGSSATIILACTLYTFIRSCHMHYVYNRIHVVCSRWKSSLNRDLGVNLQVKIKSGPA